MDELCAGVFNRRSGPGDVVVMDNLLAHKITGVRAAIEGVDAQLLFLPP